MTHLKTDQRGITAVLALVVISVIGLAGFAGYQVVTSQNPAVRATLNNPADDSAATPDIKGAADVDAATKELDSTAIDSELDDSSLDAEVNAL